MYVQFRHSHSQKNKLIIKLNREHTTQSSIFIIFKRNNNMIIDKLEQKKQNEIGERCNELFLDLLISKFCVT